MKILFRAGRMALGASEKKNGAGKLPAPLCDSQEKLFAECMDAAGDLLKLA